jgi:Domain of unknown function (DUF1996)
MDPIVSPGKLSEHAHAIMGSSGFGMNANHNDLTAGSACTSCAVLQDKSAYWYVIRLFDSLAVQGLLAEFSHGSAAEIS